jgi:hypothetical protein
MRTLRAMTRPASGAGARCASRYDDVLERKRVGRCPMHLTVRRVCVCVCARRSRQPWRRRRSLTGTRRREIRARVRASSSSSSSSSSWNSRELVRMWSLKAPGGWTDTTRTPRVRPRRRFGDVDERFARWWFCRVTQVSRHRSRHRERAHGIV